MKIITTLTAEEKNKTLESVMFDPCTHILCSEIDCDGCPLREVGEALRRAQEDYARALNKMVVEGE